MCYKRPECETENEKKPIIIKSVKKNKEQFVGRSNCIGFGAEAMEMKMAGNSNINALLHGE